MQKSHPTYRNFIFEKCTRCKEFFRKKEGDVIYGDKWYHGGCWEVVKRGNNIET